MTIGKRLAVGFDRYAWAGFGFFFHTETLWIDFMGFYLSLHLGRQEKTEMTHHTDELLDEIEDRADDAKSEGKVNPSWLEQEAAREANFKRQFALDKAVQMARSALAHGRVSEANAADFTISAAEKFFSFMNRS